MAGGSNATFGQYQLTRAGCVYRVEIPPMRLRLIWISGLMAALLGPASGLPQSGGPAEGRGSYGRPGLTTERNERFSQYTGGGNVWLRSDIRDPDQLRSFARVAQALGNTDGVITRQQYADYYQQMGERFGGPRFGDPPSAIGGAGSPAGPGMPGSSPSEGRGRPGGGGSDSRGNWADGM